MDELRVKIILKKEGTATELGYYLVIGKLMEKKLWQILVESDC